MITIWVTLLLLAAVAWIIYQFNTLVGLSNSVDAVWADMDTLLVRRYGLASKLLDLVQPLAPAGGAVLDQLAVARSAALNAYTPAEKNTTEPPLVTSITTVLDFALAIPQFVNHEELGKMRQTFTDIEDYVGSTGREYNALVNELNAQTRAFPNCFLASLLGVEPREAFQPGGL
jgi:hypothetical protein